MHPLAALALTIALTLPGVAFSQTGEPSPRIVVTGEGSVEAAPDLAMLSIGVTTEGATAAEALAANSQAMRGVVDRLKAAGIAPRDLQTSQLSINPDWQGYNPGEERKIRAYIATNQVTVRVRALETLGPVLDAAVADGANTLNGLSFGLAEPRPALDEARREAVADARAKAELLAGAAGVTLGPVLSITEDGGFTAPAPMFRTEAAASDAAPPVEAGEVSASVRVTITWALAP
jgi:hypothetical protein